MRIGLHAGQLAQPVPGGIGRYVEALLDALPDAGVDVVPFGAGRPAQPPARFVDLGSPRGRWRYEAWHRFRRPRVRLPGAPVDLIHAPSLAVPPADPLVVTVHDLAFRAQPDSFTRRGRAFHERGLTLAREHAAAVLTPSHFTRDGLLEAGFEAHRIHVAPHGVDTTAAPGPGPGGDAHADSRTDPVADTLRRSGISEIDGPFVLAVGTVEPRKGFDVAAAAVGSLPGADAPTLVIAGPPGWGTVDGLDRPRVRLLGAVARDALDTLYRHALLTVVPSTYEGFGFPALEAMARGCPVVASSATSLPEVVGSAGVLLEPGDVQAWRDAIVGLIDDPDRRRELAAAGLERAATFTWERSAALHVEAYRTALATRS